MSNTPFSIGKVVSLQLCHGYRKPMQIVNRVEATENLGLKNDKHALPDSSRQILLLEKEILDQLNLVPGQVKENITTLGIQLMTLPSKARLKIGNEAILEVTKACSPCSRMDEIRQGLKLEIAGRRGMLTRVIKGGIIATGDIIKIIEG